MLTHKIAKEVPASRAELISLLRTPESLKHVHLNGGSTLVADDGESYPIVDNILCLLKENERDNDLGDDKFYDKNPFGVRDWSNPQEVEQGVEDEFKNLLKKYPQDALIIDVGAGSGRVSNYMSMNGYKNVVSLDFSLVSLKQIAKHSNNLCVGGNNLRLPVASNSFDLVVSTGVIHHTPDPHKAFCECARIVKPGGRLYFRTRNIHSLYGYLFFSYGATLRFFETTPGLRFLSTLFGFQVYKLTRSMFYSHLPKCEDQILRGKYENLFIKKMISFFTTGTVERWLKDNHLEPEYSGKASFTHRQHFYIAKKVRASA